jgi:8-oxo-dGTP diphosphatase
MVTVDVVCFRRTARGDCVLLVRRGNEPFKGCWATPGGYINMEEDLETAARRELREETQFKPAAMEQFYCFGEPGRDPRGRTISVAFLAWIDDKDESICEQIRAGDDAAEARWFELDKLPELAFDHAKIIERANKVLAEWRTLKKI